MPEPSSLLREFAKAKGLASLDEPLSLFEPKAYHTLLVELEHCVSHRPSDHLRGSASKYTSHAASLEGCLAPAAGDAAFVFKVNEPQQSATSPKRLGVDAFGNPVGKTFTGDEKFPRVGSFEVKVTLINNEFSHRYGPVLVFSKLSTGMWPSFTKLRKNVDALLQQLLVEDDQKCGLEREYRKQHPAPSANQEEGDGEAAANSPDEPADTSTSTQPAPSEPAMEATSVEAIESRAEQASEASIAAAAESAAEPAAELAAETAAESAAQAAAEPVAQAAAESAAQAAAEPTVELAAESATEPATESAAEPAIKAPPAAPAEASTLEPASETGVKQEVGDGAERPAEIGRLGMVAKADGEGAAASSG